MTQLSDAALDHLVRVAGSSDLPDLGGTRYELLEELGRGGMGSVYAAYDPALARRVALKVIRPELSSETMERRMAREARVLARLEHPGIVPVHEVGRLADGRVYYTMKFVEGERLDHVMEREHNLRERARIFVRMCEAVAFAHDRGVVHRDLKPANVMVGRFGEVLVMDWGLAKLMPRAETESEPEPATPVDPEAEAATVVRDVSDPRPRGLAGDSRTRPGSVLGTPGYMSPEQAAGANDAIDHRSDVFSLGVLLGELSESEDGRPPPPKRLVAIHSKATRHDPEERYASVEALSKDVLRFLDGESVAAYTEGPLELLGRWFQKYRAPILLLLAYLLARVFLIVFFGT